VTDSLLVQALLALGGFAGIGSVLNAFWSRRKAPADAASILTKAAGDLVTSLADRIQALEDRQRKQEAQIRAHRIWDVDVAARMRAAGIDAPEPPTLNADL
jgi:hypothetical protein